MSRASWDDYFLRLATDAATRATCDRLHVGTVLVRDKMVVATGYNGSLRGQPHCDDVGHLVINGSCQRTVHAEANAIAQAARNGARVDGATAYVTHSPCLGCFKLLANAGIARIVYREAYKLDDVVVTGASAVGIELIHLPPTQGT